MGQARAVPEGGQAGFGVVKERHYQTHWSWRVREATGMGTWAALLRNGQGYSLHVCL